MPLFGKKKPPQSDSLAAEDKMSTGNQANGSATNPDGGGTAAPAPNNQKGVPAPQPGQKAPKLIFHCQKAHGSHTGVISGFTNVKELYQKIAEFYDFDPSEILFCTLNTHKVDMTRLLGGQIGLEDFIFAHLKGQRKEVEVTKSEDALGLTITDNGAGYAFIKRIKEGSIMDKTPLVAVGDHIEKIDGKSLLGCRHFEVAKTLKEIVKGAVFTLRLVEPLKSGFSEIGASQGNQKKGNIGTGKSTLRLRPKGNATVEVADEIISVAVDKINGLLESFMGINDSELAQTIWEIGSKTDNPHDFAVAIDASEMSEFGFTDDFIFDLWGSISDAKQGRLKKTTDFSEQF